MEKLNFFPKKGLNEIHEIDLEEGPGRNLFQFVANLTHALINHLFGRSQALSYFTSTTKPILNHGQTL